MLQGNDSVSVAKDVEDKANEVSEKSPDCMVRSQCKRKHTAAAQKPGTADSAGEKG